MSYDVGPMIVKLTKCTGRSWRLLVFEDLGAAKTVGEGLESSTRMGKIRDAFKKELTKGTLIVRAEGPVANLRGNHLGIHMWLHLERFDWKSRQPSLLGVEEHERVRAFFHLHGLDVVEG